MVACSSTVCSRLELGFLPAVTLESGGAAVAMAAAAAAVVEIEAEEHKGCSLASETLSETIVSGPLCITDLHISE